MLKNVVDGREIVLSAEEEARVRAEWAAEDARQAEERAKPAPLTPFQRLVVRLIAKGVLTQAEADALR
jgi:hypothetical protein